MYWMNLVYFLSYPFILIVHSTNQLSLRFSIDELLSWCTVCLIFKSSQCMKIFCIPLFLTITIAAVIMHFALHHGSNVGKLSTHRIPIHSYFIFKDRIIVFVSRFICILLTFGTSWSIYQFEFGYTENTYFTEDNSETKQNRVSFRKLKNQSLSFSTLLSANWKWSTIFCD